MKLSPIVAQHIQEVVHDNWTDIYLDDALQDVTYAEAVMLPNGITNSIAMLTHHLAFYNNVVIQCIQGINPVINNANGFDVVVSNDEDWQQVKANALASFKNLADAVKNLPDEKLWQHSPGGHTTFYKTFHGIAEHAHYHLGQIVLIKKIIRAK